MFTGKNVCRDHRCVSCCYGTEMLLSKDYVRRIMSLGFKEDFFAVESRGFKSLRNSNEKKRLKRSSQQWLVTHIDRNSGQRRRQLHRFVQKAKINPFCEWCPLEMMIVLWSRVRKNNQLSEGVFINPHAGYVEVRLWLEPSRNPEQRFKGSRINLCDKGIFWHKHRTESRRAVNPFWFWGRERPKVEGEQPRRTILTRSSW